MKKIFKGLGLGLIALALVVGVGAVQAEATLTLDALTITSSGALTLDGAAASNVNLGAATTSGVIAIGVANTGGINIGAGNTAKTINLGTGTAIDTINIGTGATGVDVITVGSATATLVLRAGSAAENELWITATDDGAGSFQGIWADVTLPAAAMTSSYHGGIMGNVFGTDLADTDSAMFGVLGKYTIDGTNASTEPSGGVIGEISGDPITTTADGAVIAVLGGDAGIATANAAFKVMGQNSTAGSGFTYGLDLFNANTGAYLDNDQIITTDIRFQNGATIDEGTDGTLTLTDATWAEVGAETTRATGATGSFQTVWGDLTYQGAAGGTSAYHAGVMGNFLGDNLTNTTSSLHAGVIGSYNVTTDDDNTGGSAGVIGEVR